MPIVCRNPLVGPSCGPTAKHAVLDSAPTQQPVIPMSPFGSMRHRHPWLAAFALLAFTVRALIPVGFMPSGDGFFKLQICPEGLSTQALALLDPHAAHHHHHLATADGKSPAPAHDHRSWASGHCPFGALATALQSVHPVSVVLALEVVSASAVAEPVRVLAKHRFWIAQSRGPPFLV
jgi:hypothetical protein